MSTSNQPVANSAAQVWRIARKEPARSKERPEADESVVGATAGRGEVWACALSGVSGATLPSTDPGSCSEYADVSRNSVISGRCEALTATKGCWPFAETEG